MRFGARSVTVSHGSLSRRRRRRRSLWHQPSSLMRSGRKTQTLERVCSLSAKPSTGTIGARRLSPYVPHPPAHPPSRIEMGEHLAYQLISNLAAAAFFALALELSFVTYIPTALRLGAGCGISMLVSVLGLRIGLGLLVSDSFSLQPFTWQNVSDPLVVNIINAPTCSWIHAYMAKTNRLFNCEIFSRPDDLNGK